VCRLEEDFFQPAHNKNLDTDMINICEGTFVAMRRQLNAQSNTTETDKVKSV